VDTVTQKLNDSPCWKEILKVKEPYLAGKKISMGKGNITRHWKDSLEGERPLCDQYPILFDLSQNQDYTVKTCRDANFVIQFRRRLRGEMLEQWTHIVEVIISIHMSNENDTISWSMNNNAVFSTKSVYSHLERNLARAHNKWISKSKLPWKIKIFLWQLGQGAVLTRKT
jgi:hypothetical protein